MRLRRACLVVSVVLLAGVALPSASSAALVASPGSVIGWGDNGSGELGNATTDGPDICGSLGPCSQRPVAVNGLSSAVGLAAGAYHSLAVLSNGTVMAWGDNGYGQLGDGTTTRRDTPVAVSGVSGAVAVAAGVVHSLALLSNGTVMAWGTNGNGELGDGTTTQRDTPVPVSGLSGVSAIAAASDHSLALLANGTVMAWGGTTSSLTPVVVSGLSGVTAIAAGSGHSLALLSNGTVMAWGANSSGQLGDGTTTLRDTPVPVSGLSGVTAIAAGRYHSLALLSNGTVMAWGDNTHGQLGDGTTTQRDTPVAVSGLTGVTAIAAGIEHSVALLSNGTVMTWGANFYGQLGDGTIAEHDTPMAVPGLSGVGALASEPEAAHTLVIEEGAFATVSPAALAFGSQLVGSTSAPQIVTLANAGPKPLSVSGDTLTGISSGAFASTADSCTGMSLLAGASCQLSFSFAPAAPGGAAAALAVTSDAANTLALVSLSGQGVAPAPPPPLPPSVPPPPTTSPTLPPPAGSPPLGSSPPLALVLSGVRQSHSRWRAGNRLATITRVRRLPVGTTFGFTLSRPASVRFTFTQQLAGRRVSARCLVLTARNAHNHSCTLNRSAGRLSLEGHTGTNSVTFQGRVTATRELAPGRYELEISAVDPAGQHAASSPLSFTVVRR